MLDAKEKIDSLRNKKYDEEEMDSTSSAERESGTDGQRKKAIMGIAPEKSEKITGIESECAKTDTCKPEKCQMYLF